MSAVRPSDLVGRLGGDEFIAFCQNVRDEIVIEKKSRFINKYILEAAKEFMGEDMQIPLGASLGCVFVPKEGTDFKELFKKADKALYTVKQNGKHGFIFYKDEESKKEQEEAATSDIANAVKILSERGKPQGGFVLPYEQFRTVFQYLARLTANYQKEVWLLLFTLSEKDPAALPLEEASEQFCDVLKKSLRQSDVITQSGKNQFIVMLSEVASSNIETVTDRIMEAWSKEDASAYSTVSYELDVIK